MQKTFFISDMHFGHNSILLYENRPFKDVNKMNESIINNWNKKIKKEHYVYVLGDVSFYPKDKTVQIISQLNGIKILIMGNHDRSKSTTYWRNMGFQEVSKYPILFEDKFLLSHEPRYEINNTDLYFNIHGHTHTKKVEYNPLKFYNACVEVNNYTPIDFEKVKEYFNKKN